MMLPKKNYIFIGEAGCGKSEIALNTAIRLSEEGEKKVYFFDLDQTKPLFRSRTVKDLLEAKDITFHYQEQINDAPTLVGGVAPALRDKDCHAVLDIGGNANGARALGCFANFIREEDSEVFYVINPYLPWSEDVNAIDVTLTSILKASRIKKFRILSNPNVGYTTTAEEFLAGHERVKEMISPYFPVDAACVAESLYDEVKERTDAELFPLRLHLTYPWINLVE